MLRPGLFGKVRATVEQKKDAILVPQRSVTEIQGRYLVAVVTADNKVDLRPVIPGERIGSDWIINEGLKNGEVIVLEGTQKVRPGSPVIPKAVAPSPQEKTAPPQTPEKKG